MPAGNHEPPRQPGTRRPLEEALQQLFGLPWRDLYEAWSTVGSYLLAADDSPESTERALLRERAECLDDMAAAASELKLPQGQWPKVREYQQARKQLGLTYSTQQIQRRWGSWDEAGQHLVGVRHRIRETPRQRSLRRATAGKQHKAYGPLVAVRAWLQQKPPPASLFKPDYDDWADEANARLSPGEKRYPKSYAVMANLSLNWAWTLAVASVDVELPDAQQRFLAEMTAATGSYRLVSGVGISILLGKRADDIHGLMRQPGFPLPVLLFGRKRAWYRDDIERFRDGRRMPARQEGELNKQLLLVPELLKLLQRTHASRVYNDVNKQRWDRAPRPAGTVAGSPFWERDAVATWLQQHPRTHHHRG